MKQVISYHLRKTAELFLFAAGLDKEKLYDIFEKLRDIIKDESLFEVNQKDPLTFNKKGLQKIKDFGITLTQDFPTFKGLVKRIDDAIKLSAKSGDADMKSLDSYLATAFRPHANRWYNVGYKGLHHPLAKDKALSQVVEPMLVALESGALEKIHEPHA